MINFTIIFLCIYHLILSLLGSLFFENYLFKDFENSFSLVKVIFCFSFVLCLSLLSMILFEILGFITTTLKLFIWYIDITLLILFIYLIIPVSLIYTYITYEDEKVSRSLFKFKYFYTILTKMKHKKINELEEDKKNFMRRLVYISEDLISKMKNYNRKIKKRNKQKILKFFIGCLFFLPIIWFTFYKISMITLKNNSDVYEKSDMYNIGTILQEKFNKINKELNEEYDINNEKTNNSPFIKIMKNLLIYISVTGMTIVSALSAFTSLYSPYTNISNFFFFVTINKVKIIEKKIKFITDELSSKKKMLLLYENPHLINSYFKNMNEPTFNNKGDIYTNANNNYKEEIEFEDLATYTDNITHKDKYKMNTNNNLNFNENINICNIHNTNDMHNNSIDHCYGRFTHNISPFDNLQNNLNYNTCQEESLYNNNDSLNHEIIQNENNFEYDDKKRKEKSEYACFNRFKKCNLYLDSHKSIYKDIYETFMKKEKNFDNLFNINEDIYDMKEIEMIEKKESKLIEKNDEFNETYIDRIIMSTKENSNNKITTPFEKSISSSNSLFKRNVKSDNLFENKHVNYKRKFIFFKTKDNFDEKSGTKEENDSGAGKNKSFFYKYTVYSFKKIFQNYDTLPHNVTNKENVNLNKNYISAFLFNSFHKPYKTFHSVKEFFMGKKRNINKKKKEILIQDIKALEYMVKKLYFLLDEVIKEQIRVNHSTTFFGILLYLLGIIMSILCLYKIIKTCYIIYMIEIHYRFISTYSNGHVLMLFYAKNMNISIINELKNVLHIVNININLDNYVISITSILLLCFIFTNLKTFMEKIIKLRYSTKSSLYSNLAILLMCEIMDLYFSAYCIQLFDYLPIKEKIKMLYIFFNNNLLNLFKLKYHFDFVYVISLFVSLILIKFHHKHRTEQFKEI
ncbi:conserved Plasmodium protein, unknown function [Plasmodium relictum]|uniref:Protein GPR89 n=1 Tax=Plasmodium relictum TaxID=85471 RepID=A0A1J1HD74_PLARL|nr:conserved Plasmodium protein, unknown function [Plasmodium relictum]CRH03937.1 conserved Plasmodium protein, unknown function [Plasmodium relictum]